MWRKENTLPKKRAGEVPGMPDSLFLLLSPMKVAFNREGLHQEVFEECFQHFRIQQNQYGPLGKNQYNNSFPIALACYRRDHSFKAVYLMLDKKLKITLVELSFDDLFNSQLPNDQLYFAFEANFEPYQSKSQAAHYILGPFGPDCELRSYGLRVQSRGGKIGKKKSFVAVARKLVTVMLALWKNPETAYDPNFKKTKKAV